MKTTRIKFLSQDIKEIDFSEKGILVISKDLTEVLVTNGEETQYCFSAYCLASKLSFMVGKNDYWIKTSFTKLTKPITITFEN